MKRRAQLHSFLWWLRVVGGDDDVDDYKQIGGQYTWGVHHQQHTLIRNDDLIDYVCYVLCVLSSSNKSDMDFWIEHRYNMTRLSTETF